MQKEGLRIVFMGTPDFAVESLKALVENNYNVVGVITVPDKPAGRGQKIRQSAVKKYAMEQNLNVLQPVKLKDPEFIEELKALNANLQIIVAFRMLPEIVWNMPEYGTFNLHGSLLPHYRGAAPINWAVINGDNETGVTTFFLKHEIDTGNVIFQERMPIELTDNAGSVHDKMMIIGGQLVTKTVKAIEEGNYPQIDQSEFIKEGEALKEAPKIFKNSCKIDWSKSIKSIYDFIRGLSPYPAAWAELVATDGKATSVKIFETEMISEVHSLPIGAIRTDNKKFIHIAVESGFINILHLQIAGKKRLLTEELLRGFNLSEEWSVSL